METDKPVNTRKAWRAITVFFYAMILGLLSFSVIVFGLNMLEPPAINDESLARIFFIVALIIMAVSFTAATYLYKKRMAAARSQELNLIDKLTIYRSVLILYLALCEGPGLFAVITYFLTGYKPMLFLIAVNLLTMLLKRPEKSKIFNELELNSSEQSELN